MEIEMILSSALEGIVSPHDLAAAIGIAHGAKLWLRRDNTGGQRAATKVIVHCEKPTASRLRHRFSTSRAYVHDGWPASLKFVGMRPVVTSHHFPAKALLLHHQGVNAVASMAGVEPTSSCIAATTHTTSSLGVEAALELVARGEAADLRVPGISELYQEFQRGANETSGDVKGVGARRRRSRRRRAHANEGKVGTYTRRVEEGKLFLDEIATCSSEEYGGSSSSEMKRGSSADSFVLGDSHRVGHGEGLPRDRGQHNRRHRHRRHSRARSEEEEGEIKPKKQQRVIAAHRRRRHHRRHQALACTTRSVADVASALDRISRDYPDAPRSVGRTGVLSILAKMYADGAAFAGNRQRDIEMLDRLGVARWSARIYPNLFPQDTTRASEAGLPEASKKAWEGWFRILGRAVALVRNIADFGTFVQVYVAAAERDRLRVPSSSVVAAVAAENCARGGRKDRGRRVRSPSPHLGATNDDGDDNDEYFNWKARPRSPPSTSACSLPRSRINAGLHNITKTRGPITCGGRGTALQAACKGADDADTGMETPPQRHVDDLAKKYCKKLRWLFPACHGDSGGRAFARHAICGGGSGVHGLVTLEAAAAIIRDAGKYISMERVWRWFCDWSSGNHNVGAGATKVESASSGRGRLLRFEDFVEMCDGLREHMEDVPIMSDDTQSNIHTIT